MNANPTSTVADVNETVVGLVTSVQDRIVDANRGVAARAAGVLPALPFAGTAASTTLDLAEQAYELQSKMLDANRRFAVRMFEAWAPVVDKGDAE